ncbi:hypothetical protein ElyMa_002860600 [Elysia marginata]|uniref:Uncharacterized protein n=1 Tax=Elysia marginata TaxID=1093978 RepID=A0AAV4HZZ3_9GAST|nr:hypothetical protein ElyMa_002860600 [Elysia marginata]
MATVQRPRFPRIDKSLFATHTDVSTFGGKQHRQPGAKTELPGIGSYVIDSPEDKNLGVRQQCLRYQESHRGVIRAKSGSKIPPPQEELVSRSPIGRLSQCSPTMQQSGAPITGFGVRKPKPSVRDFNNFRKEYTNLSVNLELGPPDHITYKATERELNSQADYRRQLTFYLTPIKNNGQEISSKNGIHGSNFDGGVNNSALRNIPKDKIGSSTRHQVWASNLRLGELLVQQNRASPSLKRKLAASRTRSLDNLPTNGNNKTLAHSFRTARPFIYGSPLNRFRSVKKDDREVEVEEQGENDSDGDGDEEVWLSMVDTPLVECSVYDRYANVKLPRSRIQPTGTART